MSGTINSVVTNTGAMIALESLDKTNTSLQHVQKQVSTGYRVADATDDGAAFAVAQSVRSTIGALTSANQQLGGVQGLLSTTNSSLTDISNTMGSMRDVLIKLADDTVEGNERTQYMDQYKTLLGNVQNFIEDANYSGKTLIGNIGANTAGYGTVHVVRNENADTYTLTSFGGASLYSALAAATGFGTAAGVASAFSNFVSANNSSATGFISEMNTVGGWLNTVGSSVNYVNNQISYNNNKIDALNSGLGSLVDADLAKESALLQSLQIQQQLGTQALTLANQAPQTLLSLFK